MDVILREDIDALGRRGQVVKVAPGYARNFLLPKRLAVAATEANKKIVEQERQAHQIEFPHVFVFVLVNGLKPAVVAPRELPVVVGNQWRQLRPVVVRQHQL